MITITQVTTKTVHITEDDFADWLKEFILGNAPESKKIHSIKDLELWLEEGGVFEYFYDYPHVEDCNGTRTIQGISDATLKEMIHKIIANTK